MSEVDVVGILQIFCIDFRNKEKVSDKSAGEKGLLRAVQSVSGELSRKREKPPPPSVERQKLGEFAKRISHPCEQLYFVPKHKEFRLK